MKTTPFTTLTFDSLWFEHRLAHRTSIPQERSGFAAACNSRVGKGGVREERNFESQKSWDWTYFKLTGLLLIALTESSLPKKVCHV